MSVENSPHTQTRLATWVGIGLVILFAAIYLFTLDNSFQPEELRGGDLITHQYAQVQARPANAPGYPLYTMGGWLWYRAMQASADFLGESYPNPIPLLSSYSTLWALLSLWLLYQIVRFVTGSRYRQDSSHGRAGNWILAALIAAFYGVTYFFWYYATTTEQYSSAIAQTLAIFYLYLLWSERARSLPELDAKFEADSQQLLGPDHLTPLIAHGEKEASAQALHARFAEGAAHRDRQREYGLLVALALLCGVSLAHMLTVAFIVPPLVAVILWQRPDYLRRGWLILACVIAAALPLLAYIYVYVRGAAHPEWWGSIPYANASEWFWAFVRTSQGFQELGWGSEAGRTFFGNGFPQLIWQELSIPLLLLGLAGVALLKRRTACLIYGTAIIYLVFCWMYRYGNWYQVILPLYPLILVGVAPIFERVLQWRPLRESPALSSIPYLLIVVAIGWRAWASLPAANSHNRPGDTALDNARLLIATTPESAALFAAVDDSLALDYLVNIWQLPGDYQIVSSDQAADAAQERPLLATWEPAPTLLAEIGAGDWRVQPYSADWVQILQAGEVALGPRAASSSITSPTTSTNEFATIDAIQVAPAPESTSMPAMDVTIQWQLPLGRWPLPEAFSVRPTLRGEYIRLADGSISQYDGAPLGDLAGFALDPHAPVDIVRLPLNAPLPEGADGIQILFYRTDTGEIYETLAFPIPQPNLPAQDSQSGSAP